MAMMCNEDIKSRISYSKQVLPLHDADLISFIIAELAAVGLGANTFDEVALQVILRAVQGNLRLCRNLCYAVGVHPAMKRARKGTMTIRTFVGENKGRLVVHNTGSGISPEQMSNIFKRFHSFPIGEGTGIGLAFCKDTLAQWGAKITCKSEVGVYT